jgi:hypothetical protein
LTIFFTIYRRGVVLFEMIATLPNNRLDSDARKTRAAHPGRYAHTK